MNRELKRILLERKFSSEKYMEEMAEWHQKAIDSLLTALRQFYQHPPQHEDWHNWHQSDWPETWERRVLVNLESTQEGVEKGIEKAKLGEYRYIDSACNEIHNVFRNLSNFGWGWWKHIPSSCYKEFNGSMVKASKMASNIMDTISEYWRDDEILDEEVTGPMDEKDLLRYLEPGEKP